MNILNDERVNSDVLWVNMSAVRYNLGNWFNSDTLGLHFHTRLALDSHGLDRDWLGCDVNAHSLLDSGCGNSDELCVHVDALGLLGRHKLDCHVLRLDGHTLSSLEDLMRDHYELGLSEDAVLLLSWDQLHE
jgi:hypothetical protein